MGFLLHYLHAFSDSTLIRGLALNSNHLWTILESLEFKYSCLMQFSNSRQHNSDPNDTAVAFSEVSMEVSLLVGVLFSGLFGWLLTWPLWVTAFWPPLPWHLLKKKNFLRAVVFGNTYSVIMCSVYACAHQNSFGNWNTDSKTDFIGGHLRRSWNRWAEKLVLGWRAQAA